MPWENVPSVPIGQRSLIRAFAVCLQSLVLWSQTKNKMLNVFSSGEHYKIAPTVNGNQRASHAISTHDNCLNSPTLPPSSATMRMVVHVHYILLVYRNWFSFFLKGSTLKENNLFRSLNRRLVQMANIVCRKANKMPKLLLSKLSKQCTDSTGWSTVSESSLRKWTGT